MVFKEFQLPFKTIQINPPNQYGFDVFDLDLSLVFNKFSIDNVIKIILAILSESKLLFISKFNGLITPITEVFQYFLDVF